MPHYGFASPISSRHHPALASGHGSGGSQGYFPFSSPVQTRTPVHQEMNTDVPKRQTPSTQRSPVNINNYRASLVPDTRTACSGGCSECGPGNKTHQSFARPGQSGIRANIGHRWDRENSDSSSSEEEWSEENGIRSSPTRRIQPGQTQKKSTSAVPQSTIPLRGNRPVGCVSISSDIYNPNRSRASAAGESEKSQHPFVPSKTDNNRLPTDVNENTEAENVEEMETETKIERPIPAALNVPKIKTPTEILDELGMETKELEGRINSFTGTTKDREYILTDELLTKALLRLDAVESGGDTEIRSARKALVKQVQSLVSQLELKVRIVRMEDASTGSASDEADVCEESQDTSAGDETDEREGNGETPETGANNSTEETNELC